MPPVTEATIFRCRNCYITRLVWPTFPSQQKCDNYTPLWTFLLILAVLSLFLFFFFFLYLFFFSLSLSSDIRLNSSVAWAQHSERLVEYRLYTSSVLENPNKRNRSAFRYHLYIISASKNNIFCVTFLTTCSCAIYKLSKEGKF